MRLGSFAGTQLKRTTVAWQKLALDRKLQNLESRKARLIHAGDGRCR